MKTTIQFTLVAVITLICATFATAQSPTTAPSTDVSTPDGALRALLRALETGKPDQARALIHAATDEERKLQTAAVQLSEAVAKARAAAAEKFGAAAAEGMKITIVRTKSSVDGRVIEDKGVPDPLKDAKVTTEGDKGSIQFGADPANALVMRKIDGAWKLPIADTLAGPSRPPAAALQTAFEAITGKINKIADDVASGQIKTADEAAKALEATTQ